MPAFDPSLPETWDRRDLHLIERGSIHLYLRQSVLQEAIDFLTKAEYRVIRIDMGSRPSAIDCLCDLATALGFPGHYSRIVSLDAFDEDLRDAVYYDFRPQPDSVGTVIVLERFDSLYSSDPSAADAVLDFLASNARLAALIGHQMLYLVQSNDSFIRLKDVGAIKIQLNPREFGERLGSIWAERRASQGE